MAQAVEASPAERSEGSGGATRERPRRLIAVQSLVDGIEQFLVAEWLRQEINRAGFHRPHSLECRHDR